MSRVTVPPGRIPQLTSESPNWASSAAIARSQEIRGIKAPPKHQPLTAATVTLGKNRSFV